MIPASVTSVTVTARYVKADGSPATGIVRFQLSAPASVPVDQAMVPQTSVKATLDAAGAFSVPLAASDDPDWAQDGLTYQVTERITGAELRTYNINLPADAPGATVDLASLAPAVPGPPLISYVLAATVGAVGGPAGPLDADGKLPAAQVPASASPVQSVAGKTGAVTLVAADVAGVETPAGAQGKANAAQAAAISAAATSAAATFLTPADPRARHDRVLRAAPVANNCWAAGTPTNQTVAGTARTRHRVGPACSDLRLVYGGWYCADPATSGVDTDQPTTIPVKASVEIGGVIYRVTFGGLIQGTVDPGGMLVSDPLGFEIAAGTDIFVRTYTSSVNWFSNSAVYSGYTSGGWNAADLTAPGSAAIADSAHFIYAPYAVLGMPVNRSVPTVAILGDSIAAGNADNNAYVAWGNGGTVGGGPISRALTAAGIGYVNLAHAGERASTFVLGVNRYRRSSMISGCTHAIVEYGVNDYRNARTAAQMQADLLAIWTAATKRGCKVHQTTITPNTSSTDAYATTVNQTIVNAGFEAARVALNDWLRDSAPILNGGAVATGSNAQGTLRAGAAGHPLTGYFEIADLAETARNSGIWRAPGYTTDGVHPTTTAAAAMTAGITTASLTLP